MDLLQGNPCFSQFLYFFQTACQTHIPVLNVLWCTSLVLYVEWTTNQAINTHCTPLKLLHSILVFYFLSTSSSPFSPVRSSHSLSVHEDYQGCLLSQEDEELALSFTFSLVYFRLTQRLIIQNAITAKTSNNNTSILVVHQH